MLLFRCRENIGSQGRYGDLKPMPLQNKLLKILRGKVLLAFQLFWQKEVKVDTNQSFKNKVKEVVISGAKSYQDYFIDYDYLLCSDIFNTNDILPCFSNSRLVFLPQSG